jgi:aerobic-type carbon monoxide dehydrogenase small subunit (CoxS/CutS family)
MSQDRSEITRRDVLRGAGVAAFLGAMAPLAKGEEPAATPGVTVLGPAAAPVELDVNNKSYTVLVEPRVTLLDALRDHAGLTGTKRVCEGGACGGCTVMVDGKTVNSCLMLAVEARGKKIRTIEGLEQDGKLHPVQDAFIEHDALQCGFCTPGMIMSCTALVEANTDPNPEEVKAAVAGNLCRCGTYPHVFEACRTAAQSMRKAKK